MKKNLDEQRLMDVCLRSNQSLPLDQELVKVEGFFLSDSGVKEITKALKKSGIKYVECTI
ncbi:hypothetical protein HanRHA438_Chr03g0136691 [Helianthus annuus]|nr:hypothetical protein HanRHA438_Chr03g0136691 [Helianthus annuus]